MPLSTTRAGAPHQTARKSGAMRAASIGGLALALAAASAPADAQDYAQHIQERNTKKVTIVAGAPGETALSIAHDLATVLHCVDGLRVVPMAGRGDRNNVYDLLFLEGVDLAIVRADVLDHIEETGELRSAVPDLKEKIVYVAPLYEQEVHLIAPRSIGSVKDLQGKIVNIGSPGSLGLAARRILEQEGVKVIETKLDNALALERVIEEGGIDAMFITGGKPIPLLEKLDRVAGLHLVPLPRLNNEVYSDGAFTQDDYPSLVPPGRNVSTVTVPSVLAIYNWPTKSSRYPKNALFTKAMFKRAAYLKRPARHPKWRGAALSGEIPGWKQFAPAREIAEPMRSKAETVSVATPRSGLPAENTLEAMFQRQLDEFGIQPRTEEERALLFAAFKRRVEASIR